MAEFTLRPMRADDGPAVDRLMRTEPQTTAVSLSTRYLHDLYEALVAQHPTMYGVVATVPPDDAIVGVATASTDRVAINGELRPSAFLANLKVRHDVRRQGLGGRLAAWRIDQARRRFGSEGVIFAGIEASNVSSLATARRWATQLLGPVRIVIGRPAGRPPETRGLTLRPLSPSDVPAIVERVNAFHDRDQLYPRQTAETLTAFLAPTPIGSFRQYRVVAAADGEIVAGAAVTERFKVMEDHFDRVPRPLALLSRIYPIIPPDRTLRTAELGLAWYAPDRADAGRFLWDAIRHEWRGPANTIVSQVDPRSPLADVFRVGRGPVPRVEIMIPVQSPVPLDEDRPLYLWR